LGLDDDEESTEDAIQTLKELQAIKKSLHLDA
jgi:hypothetical protein